VSGIWYHSQSRETIQDIVHPNNARFILKGRLGRVRDGLDVLEKRQNYGEEPKKIDITIYYTEVNASFIRHDATSIQHPALK